MRRTHTAFTLGVAVLLTHGATFHADACNLGLVALATDEPTPPPCMYPMRPDNPRHVLECDVFYYDWEQCCIQKNPPGTDPADLRACLGGGVALYSTCVDILPLIVPRPTESACILQWEGMIRNCRFFYQHPDLERRKVQRERCEDNAETYLKWCRKQIPRAPGGGEGLPDPCNPTYDPGLITLSVSPADMGTGNQIDGGTGQVTGDLIEVVPASRDLVVCPNLSQAIGVPDEAGAVQAALSTRVTVISEHLPEPLLIGSQLWYVNGQLSVDYQVPRAALEAVGAEFTLAVAVFGIDRVVFAKAYDVTSQYHPSDMTGDTYLDTMDIVQAVDLFVQGEVTIETVARVIDDVATSGTP